MTPEALRPSAVFVCSLPSPGSFLLSSLSLLRAAAMNEPQIVMTGEGREKSFLLFYSYNGAGVHDGRMIRILPEIQRDPKMCAMILRKSQIISPVYTVKLLHE